MLRPSYYLSLFLLSLTCLACTFTGTNAQSSKPVPPQRYELVKTFRESRSILVIFQGEKEETTQKFRGWLENLKETGPRWINMDYIQASEVQDSSWKNEPTILLGTVEGNPFLKDIQPNLPISIENRSFSFAGKTFDENLSSLNLSFIPNPLNDTMPLSVVTGNSDEAIWERLNTPTTASFSNPLWSNYGYEISEGQDRLMVGLFDEQWKYSEQMNWSFFPADAKAMETSLFRLNAHGFSLNEGEKQSIQRQIEDQRNMIQAFFDTVIVPAPFDVHLYKDAELMGLQVRKMLQGYVKGQTVHKIYHPAVKDLPYGVENRLLLGSLGLSDIHPYIMEGLIAYFTPNWQGKGVEEWGIRLATADAFIESGDRWNEDEFGRSSIYVRAATAGAFVHYLADQQPEILKSLPRDPKGSMQKIRQAEEGFEAYFKAKSSTYAQKTYQTPFLRGMTLAHEGYNVYNGYASQLANESLAKIRGTKGNTVAIVPYSGSRNTSSPVKFNFWEGPGTENSMSIVFAKYHAAQHGMTSLLKPQIYFGGSWPGGVDMKDPKDWPQWLAYYKRWITHYALIAEMFDFDYLCLGVEFVHATLKNPDYWRQLSKDMRQIYRGPITYAANWGDEAEKIQFAEELDFLGVNSYYPLNENDDPTQEELKQGAENIMQRMRTLHQRTGKDIVFTEIGFRSIQKPWKEPHAEPKGARFNEQDQALCYELLLEAMDGEEWCKGMYWWKWPSYLDYGKENPRSFTPCGKEAEAILKKWFGKWENL
ncbi:MAG: hypothetical protein AAFY71_07340 [Bacteroidota bacterium]